MKLHWSLSNLIVGTIALSMLLTTPALAEPCFTCCPNGPLCDTNPNNLNYRIVVNRNILYTNAQVNRYGIGPNQWNDVAGKLINWKKEADNNGTMASINLFFKNNQTVLEAPTFDMSKLVPALQSMGYAGTWKQLAWAMNKLTQTQRIAMVKYVLVYGYDGVTAYAIAQAQAIAKGLAAHQPMDLCAMTEGGAYWFGFAAAASALIGQEELVIPLGFVGATFGLAGWMGGCF